MVCDSNTTNSYSWYYYNYDEQACNYINIIGTNISSEFNLECDGFYACDNLYVDVLEAKVININAVGTRSIYESEIHGENSGEVNIISYAEDYIYCANDYSCAPRLYLPSADLRSSDSDTPTTIHCQGYGCYNLNLYSLNGLLDYEFKLNGCGFCSDNYLCYADWNINCGARDYEDSMTVWSGSWCWDSVCGCTNSQQDALTDSWDNYNSLTCSEEINEYNYTCSYDDDYPGYCIIDCAEEYYTMDGCRNKIINATNEASSIIINCGNSGVNADGTGSDLGLCENAKIYCPDQKHTECIVNCMEDDSCSHLRIYAEPSTSHVNTLWVNCSDYGSCEYTKIIAPELKQVDVFCDNTDACYGISVEATYVDTMNIVCKSSEETYYNYNNYWWWWDDTDYDDGGRRRRTRRRRLRTEITDKISDERTRRRLQDSDSEYDYSYWWDWYNDNYNYYYDWYYDYYDWGDWDYRSNYACDQITVDANYSTDFNIFCNGNNSCYYSMFYGDFANNINLTAIGQQSMYISYLYGQNVDENVHVKCWSAYNYDKTEEDLNDWFGWYDYDYWSWFLSGACDYAYFYVPEADKTAGPKTEFVCEGYGCYNLNVYSQNGLDDLNILIDGCKTCASIEECIGSWSVNCKADGFSSWYYYYYDTFNGEECVYGYCDCDTDQISYQDSVSCAYQYDNRTYPTVEPTTPSSSYQPTSAGGGLNSNNHNGAPGRGPTALAIVIVIVVMTIIFCIILCCYHKRMVRKRHVESSNVNNNNFGNNNNVNHAPIPISEDIVMAKDLAMQTLEGAETTKHNNVNATMVVPQDDDEEIEAQFIPPATFNDTQQDENDDVGLIN